MREHCEEGVFAPISGSQFLFRPLLFVDVDNNADPTVRLTIRCERWCVDGINPATTDCLEINFEFQPDSFAL